MAFTSPWWPRKRCTGAASPRRHMHRVPSWLQVAKVRESRQSTSRVAPAHRVTTPPKTAGMAEMLWLLCARHRSPPDPALESGAVQP